MGLALVAEGTKRWDAAVRHYRDALGHHPDLRFAANNLARILSDCDLGAACDPDEAIRIAEAATGKLRRPDPVLLNTLASAYRAAGRADDAERTAARAAQAAVGSDQDPNATSYPLGQLFRELGVRVVIPTG